jgi:hypothetical protein
MHGTFIDLAERVRGNAGAVLVLFENIQLASGLKANDPPDTI